MLEFQKRVVDEKRELDEKIKKLREFIGSSLVFGKLDYAEQWRLTTQHHIMIQYSALLGARITAFSSAPAQGEKESALPAGGDGR